MDINLFFKFGYCVEQINKSDADLLLKEAKKLNYSYEEKSEGYLRNQTSLNFYNRAIDYYWDKQLNSYTFFKLFGKFSFKNIIAHRYEKGEAMETHHDVLDRSFILSILYLTDETFCPEDGGELVISRCEILNDGKIKSPAKILKKISPNHGTLVTINNLNPCILHEVYTVKSEKTRIALSCQTGFLEHLYGKI
jgi:hypothetical protein